MWWWCTKGTVVLICVQKRYLFETGSSEFIRHFCSPVQADGAWLPFDGEPFTGVFPDCGLTVVVENETLVIRNWDAAYPMRLEFVGEVTGPPRNVTFRMHMLGPYLDEPGCFTFTQGGENACPTSCMMRMGRSDNNFVTFTVKSGDSKASVLASAGLSTTCIRTV